jgi:hypothetical protein
MTGAASAAKTRSPAPAAARPNPANPIVRYFAAPGAGVPSKVSALQARGLRKR